MLISKFIQRHLPAIVLLSTILGSGSSLSSSTAGSSSSTCDATTAKMSALPKYRSVKRVMPRPSRHWVGDGFHVYPVFANMAFTEELSRTCNTIMRERFLFYFSGGDVKPWDHVKLCGMLLKEFRFLFKQMLFGWPSSSEA